MTKNEKKAMLDARKGVIQYVGFDKILAGKKFPMNMRALRFVVLNF